ncbi:MAG: hypothetical protein IID03_12685 [Candidatus Dadabacteria bacterium]|nr:hypothetical protein [Candidatus Dadabacteria bacterium]
MLDTQFLDITGEEIPIKKTYEFGGRSFVFHFKENTKFGFFTVEISDATGEIFLYSNKLVYNQPIMDSLLGPFTDLIIPLNINQLSTGAGVIEITRETLGNEIKLYTNITETV